MNKRKNVPKKIQLLIWNRDFWTCRYCDEPVFFNPIFKLFEELSPNHGYYHPHGKGEFRHQFIEKRMASIDHVHPLKKGGLDETDNYVTACWGCNLKWRDKLHTEGKPKPLRVNTMAIKINWDGFSTLYPKFSKNSKDEWTRLLK